MSHEPLDTELPDSFDSLLRAAVDIPDAPVAPLLALEGSLKGVTLGGGRFRLRRLLGKGGMGAVFEADDLEAGARVALKILNQVEPGRIKRFKNEFRLLSDTIHPHLVRLRELFMEGGTWFFAMDLVEGSNLSAHLALVGPVGTPEREQELRRLLPQLVAGVNAIHATGHLHRDLKPANVLVSREGCLVIVDFGLVSDSLAHQTGKAALPEVAGTVPYMAPEQARGEPAIQASDWYAVGTLIHEALTGRTPFTGDATRILEQKRRAETPTLFSDERPWPVDLTELCRDLLSPEPASRPGPDAILSRLAIRGSAAPAPVASRTRPAATPTTLFVGRTRELATLSECLTRAASGSLVICRVSGAPGIGKSALVQEFLHRAAGAHRSVALVGRCYEREATPFKLLGGLVDSLFDAIERHVPDARGILAPLSSLFLGLAPRPAGEPVASQLLTAAEVRDCAVRAFRTALTELALIGTVILHVDDVQWGDADGAALLGEILEAPAPPVLLVLTHRAEEATDSLRGLWSARFLASVAVVDLQVGGLPMADLVALVRAMAEPAQPFDADLIARESEGNPYLAQEITRHALHLSAGHQQRAPDPTAARPTLGDTILSRFGHLPGTARRVLEALSVCDGPMPLPVLGRGAGVDDIERAVAVLRSASFVRTRLRDVLVTEPYHDRVREAVQQALSEPHRRGLHRGLAAAYEALLPDAWEQLLLHHEGAGDAARAALYARRSAARAARAQAFEHAATLYRRALQLGSWPAADIRDLEKRLGDALAMCGHNADAAEAYDRAADTGSEDRVHLELLAAGQLLCSGQVLAGVARLTRSVGYLGITIPRDQDILVETISCLVQAMGEAKGLVYREETEMDERHLLRVDACWWAAKGLYSVNHPAGPFLSSFHLLEAVRSGDPMRIARGAYAHATYVSAPGSADLGPLVLALMEIGDRAAEQAPSSNTRFWRECSLAWQSHFTFDVERTAAHVDAAFQHASAGGHGLESEMALLSTLEAIALLARFEDPAQLRRSETWKRDALRRGDRHLTAYMQCLDAQWWLNDAPEPFRASLLDLLGELSRTSGEDQLVVWSIHSVLSWVERYLGLSAEAFARMASVVRRVQASPYWMVPRQRVFTGAEYVASVIAHAEQLGHLDVLGDADDVLLELPPEACGMAALFRAGMAHLRGDRSEMGRLLERAEAEPGMERTRVVSTCARHFRGQLLGGSDGRTLVDGELQSLREFGCEDPQRLIHSWWPGFRGLGTGN